MKPSLRPDLLAWFDHQRRDLPWRRTRDPYAIWISEVMLQQTQVATVIPYWTRFLARFPTVASLAAAPLTDVLSLWRGLGYYSRARNLHLAAQEIVTRFSGALPPTAAELSTLPGFGPYTSGAVASIAFSEPAPLVDGNVARVLSRLFVVEGAPGDRVREKKLWALAAGLVPGPRPGDWNQALMELGALVCKPDAPLCLICPVRIHCQAHELGRVSDLPPPRVRAAPKRLRLAVAYWARRGSVLLARRAERGLFGGLWELPSVEVTRPQPGPVTLAFAQALGMKLTVGASLGLVRRQLTHRNLELHLFSVSGRRVPAVPAPYSEFRWVTPAAARELGMSTAMVRALDFAVESSPA